MTTKVADAERLLNDFQHGRKLGERSTERLLILVLELARNVEALEKQSLRRVREPLVGYQNSES